MNIIHIALAFHDPKGTYSQHAGVAMASIFDHTKSPVCVHILHDHTLTDLNRSRLHETAKSFNQQAEFHDISPCVSRLEDISSLLGARNVNFGKGNINHGESPSSYNSGYPALGQSDLPGLRCRGQHGHSGVLGYFR